MSGDIWTRFQLMRNPAPSVKELKANFGMSKTEAIAMIDWLKTGRVYLNSQYQVHVREHDPEGWPPMWHLSIKRIDKAPVHDWRHFQRIKNELIGPESEAVELYPAEARLVDTSNQYHLYALRKIGQQFPFGMRDGRTVLTQAQVAQAGARQRDPSKGGV
jgi:hypothetical protein